MEIMNDNLGVVIFSIFLIIMLKILFDIFSKPKEMKKLL